MGLAGNVGLLYFAMAFFMWLGGVAEDDSVMQTAGLSGIDSFVTVQDGGMIAENDTLSLLLMNQSAGTGATSGSFIQSESGIDIISSMVSGGFNFITGPLSFLISAGMPREVVVGFGGILLISGVFGLAGFFRGKDL